MNQPQEQADAAREAFQTDFARFTSVSENNLPLADAENLQRELADVRVKHTGKKSEIANLKKLIGQVAPEERGTFGKLIQSLEAEVGESITNAENHLKTIIETAKTERERLDVTLPGVRPRTGHLHILTILRQQIEDIFVSMGYAIEDDREI